MTGVFYLLVRLGVPSPLHLAWVDGVHIYVGSAGAVVILGKMSRIGFRYQVRGVTGVVAWQRWISWSLLTFYAANFLTGTLLLLPIRGRVYENLVESHLLLSIWAVPPTTWHVWHYRQRALPYLTRWTAARRPWRYWAGISLLAVPAVWLLFAPRGVSQLPQVLAGSAWEPAGLSGDYLDRLTFAADGSWVAAGDAVYISHDGVIWQEVDLPASSPGSSASQTTSAGEPPGHHHVAAPPGFAQALAVSGNTIYVGTATGLYETTTAGGDLVDLHAPAHQVRGIAVDPGSPSVIWAASDAGPLMSADGGKSWTISARGIGQPAGSQAVAFFDGQLFASDASGVYEWQHQSADWVLTSNQRSVVSLDAEPGALYAVSSLGTVDVLGAGSWTALADPGAGAHIHGGVQHEPLAGVTGFDGRLYVAGSTFGVPASADGGRTWTQLGGGLGETSAPGQLVEHEGQLWAATTDGLYLFQLVRSQPASTAWWAGLVAAAVVCGFVAIGIMAYDPPRRRRGRARSEAEAAVPQEHHGAA